MSQTTTRDGTLVAFPGALGDFVCFLPALEAIRSRGERVTLLCKDELRRLARLAGVAETVAIESRIAGALFATEPSEEADAFYGRFRSIRSFTGAGVPEVARNVARWAGAEGHVSPARPPDRVHAAVHFLREVGVEARALPSVALAIPAELRAAARERFPVLVNNRRLLLVHPGSGGRSKRWSSAGFRSMIRAWRANGGRAAVILGPAELVEAAAWERADAATIAPADPTELAATLAQADLYLGNDSGPTHLAAAVGARGVALFGASDPVIWRPLGRRIEALELTPWTMLDSESSLTSNSLVSQALTRAARAALA